jgi:hypothetical protein
MNMNLRISSESSEQAKQLLFFMTPFLIHALLFHVKQNAFQETKRAHPPHIVGTTQTAVITHIPTQTEHGFSDKQYLSLQVPVLI